MTNSNDRRTFLKRSSLIALAPTVPSFLCRPAQAGEHNDEGRILVVVQLSGGNDGINTVVPFSDEGYAKHRGVLRIPKRELIQVSKSVGLHPSLRGVSDLIEDGRLGIVQGVGYPSPSRSHDISMSTWQTARLNPQAEQAFGWLGRAMDQVDRPADGSSHTMLIGDDSPPIALRGRKSISTSLANLNEMKLDPGAVIPRQDRSDANADDLLSFITRSTLDAYATSDLIRSIARETQASGDYSETTLARRMQTIAGLIKAELGTRVYYAIQPGYDTHSNQLRTHSRLLSDLSRSLKAFLDDLQESGLGDRVVVMCFSEFGRRAKENGSNGTDHGTAGPVLLAGTQVKSGLIGETPSMTKLLKGDLEVKIDFRSIYASLLEDWLKLPSQPVLAADIEKRSVVL